MRRMLTFALLALALPAAASAQTVTVPDRLKTGCAFLLDDAATNLTRHFLSRNREAFRRHAKAVILAAANKCVYKANIRPETDVVQLLWVDADPLSGDDMVYRALVQKDDADPASTLLPGVTAKPSRRMFEIFISTRPKDAVASVYTSTRERNPIEEQLPAVAQAVFNPFLGLLAATTSPIHPSVAPPPGPPAAPPPPPPPPPHYATISQVALPFNRAAVHVDVRVALLSDQADIEAAVARLSTRNQFVTGARFACVRDFDAAMRLVVEASAATCAATPRACASTLIAPYEAAFTTAFAACTTEAAQKELLAVDMSYRTLVAGLAGQVDGKFDLKNSPRQRVSFGVMTAFALGGKVKAGETRVKVNDDGNLTLDPIGRQLNLVVVNVGFRPYNADAFHPTRLERFQWFAGAVVTPDVGLAIGVSAGIVRGLTLNAGAAILGVRALREGDELGAPPQDPDDPFGLSRARVWFFGLGYKFK